MVTGRRPVHEPNLSGSPIECPTAGRRHHAFSHKDNTMGKYRMALFFDGANHSEALNAAKINMDYGSFLKTMNREFDIVGARYYSGLSDDDKHHNVREFLGALSKKGYNVITKPVKKFPDGTIKANLDVELAIDMVTMAPRLDRVMLFSGDGDFTYAVDTLQRQGIFVTVCSSKGFVANELKDQCNEFLEIRDLARKFRRD